ncbi:MAG: hypothetical protein J2P48_08105 [Alphaproteobacteria bacterium]|nr:hypothetical protein [Alphaproteobacteria bacterium]
MSNARISRSAWMRGDSGSDAVELGYQQLDLFVVEVRVHETYVVCGEYSGIHSAS